MKPITAAALAAAATLVLFASPTPSLGGPAGQARDPSACSAPVAATGSYDSNWGRVDLEQDGTRIVGSYACCGGGRIRGTLTGNVIRYRWSQPGASGHGVWAIGEGGGLYGSWGYDADEADGGAWNLRPRGTPTAAHRAR
jgi:hypothetical protein